MDARPRPFRRLSTAQQGQSMTELALFMPILALGLLGVANLGLALRAHTILAQATQQAAQYVLNHPVDPAGHPLANPSTTCGASTDAYTQCTEDVVTAYLSTRGFPNSTAQVRFQATSTGVEKALISVSYPYPLSVPVPGMVNAGALRGRTLTLSSTVTTIAATPAPTITAVTPYYTNSGMTFAGYTLTWTAPANPANVTLKYRVYSHGSTHPITADSSLPSTTSYQDPCGPGGSSPIACTSTNYSYQVSAVQSDGLESSLSTEVHS